MAGEKPPVASHRDTFEDDDDDDGGLRFAHQISQIPACTTGASEVNI